MRHTWRTVARRARVNEADINDLGGWAGPRSSSTAYDHGLLEEQLREAQEKVWAELARAGYLDAFSGKCSDRWDVFQTVICMGLEPPGRCSVIEVGRQTTTNDIRDLRKDLAKTVFIGMISNERNRSVV